MRTSGITGIPSWSILLTAGLLVPASCQLHASFFARQYVPLPIPSFVNYRDPPPRDPLLFSPINAPYKQFRTNGYLGDGVQQSPYPGYSPPNQQALSLSRQIDSLRYAGTFTRSLNQRPTDDQVANYLSPVLIEQRPRNRLNAEKLVFRQQVVGSKPFLSVQSDGVQREGGEDLSSVEGFLGQPFRRPTFVSAVGTPVSGVGQNPLYTGNSIQASKLDEASDVVGVKNAGGIPAPGRLPLNQDFYYSAPPTRYANDYGYAVHEDPLFNALAPSSRLTHHQLLPSEAYRRRAVNG